MPAPAALSPPAPRGACASLALLAVLLVFTWTAARIHYVFAGNWTALFCTGADFPVPPDFVAGTYRFPGAGYDGQLYRYLAHDPFLQKDYTRYMDLPELRCRRILVPCAAWILGLGERPWVDRAYILIEMLLLALGVYWSSRLLARRGRSPAWGLLFVALPATLASFDRMLLDGPLAAWFAGFLLYTEEERWNRVWIVIALAALTRETGLLLIAAPVVFESLRRHWRRAAWFAAAAAPALAWYAYLATRLPHDNPVSLLTIPVWGILQRLLVFRVFPDPRVEWLVRITDVLAVIGLALSLVFAARWILKRPLTPVTLAVGFFAALALVMGSPGYMIEAFCFARPVSPLLLWIMLEAVSSGIWAALAPPLAISLSVSLTFGSPLVTVIRGLLGR